MNPLPAGSQISVVTENGYETIIIPPSGGGIMRFAVAGFLMFWLCGWLFGWISAFRQLMAGGVAGNSGIAIWLTLWTFGGVTALAFLVRLLTPAVPETLRLTRPGLAYDAGRPPMDFTAARTRQKDFWKQVFAKRLRVEFDTAQMRTLALREHEAGNRLTLDLGHQRIEIAKGATELEREWLHRTLSEKYRF